MDHRSFDSPMDFEYDNKRAQVPADSPWLGGTRTSHNNFKGSTKPNMAFQASTLPSRLPQTPIRTHVAAFRENPAYDFSSGGENASSPENGDNDDTPEPTRGLNENVTVFRGDHYSPSKTTKRPVSPVKSSFRESISSLKARFSPSHKSLVHKDHARTTALTARPPKRKRREIEEEIPEDSGSEYDADATSLSIVQPQKHSPRKTSRSAIEPPPTELGTIPAILKFINDHPGLPHILSWWAQMLISSILMIGVVYIFYSFWSAIQRDVDLKAEELSQDLLREIGLCTENFIAHECTRRESLGTKFKSLCDDWETCMKQDPKAVGRAKISASTWAEILNGFVEPLSGKIIFLGVSLFTIAIAVPHILFGLIRKKDFAQHHENRNASGNPFASPHEQFYTPMNNRNYDAFAGQGMTTGRRSPSKLRGLEDSSPVRRLQYR